MLIQLTCIFQEQKNEILDIVSLIFTPKMYLLDLFSNSIITNYGPKLENITNLLSDLGINAMSLLHMKVVHGISVGLFLTNHSKS